MIPLPAPVSAWQSAADKLRLPVLDSTQDSLSRLGRGPALRAERLARIAAGDPCLALELLRAANSAASPHGDQPALEDGIETVTHGVTLIGVENAMVLATRLPRIATKDAARRAGLMEAIGTAHVAGALAERWSKRAGRRSPEAHRLAAQAALLGPLLTWQAAEGAPAALSSVWRDAAGAVRAEQRMLGADLAAIGSAVCEAWRLPALAREVYAVEPGSSDRAAVAALSALLARALVRGWHDAATGRCLEMVGDRLGVDLPHALADARDGVLAAARGFAHPRLVTAARRLALDVDGPVAPDWLVAAPAPRKKPQAKPARPERARQQQASPKPARAPKPAPTPAAPTSAAPQTATKAVTPAPEPAPTASPARAREPLRPCLEALAGYVEGRLSVHDALHGLVRGMRNALGFRRVALAMLSPDRRLLIGRFSSEDDDRQFLARFRVDMSSEHLLSLLMKRQQSVLMDEGNRKQVFPRLPGAVRTLIADDGFCAMSLIVRGRPVGLFCGHWEGPQPADSRRGDYEHFKRLCTRTGRVLEKQAA